MNIAFSVRLPVDAQSVPLVRGLLRQALEHLGVAASGIDDVLLALTEACTNVVQHSGPGDDYEVDIRLDDAVCSIDVCDIGHGFDFAALSAAGASDDAERGRGVQLMRQLVDRVHFESKPTAGSIVHMENTLDYDEGSLLDKAIRG